MLKWIKDRLQSPPEPDALQGSARDEAEDTKWAKEEHPESQVDLVEQLRRHRLQVMEAHTQADPELDDAKRRIAEATDLLSKSGVLSAVTAINSEVSFWASWKDSSRFEADWKHLPVDLIEARYLSDGQTPSSRGFAVSFRYNGQMYAFRQEKVRLSSNTAEMSVKSGNRIVLKMSIEPDALNSRFVSLARFTAGDWMKDMVDLQVQLDQNRKRAVSDLGREAVLKAGRDITF